jgi:nucleoid DNA-binding protein
MALRGHKEVTKKVLARMMHKELDDLNIMQYEIIIDLAFNIIRREVNAGRTVNLKDFGVFHIKSKRQHATNRWTGLDRVIEDFQYLKFSVSKSWKNFIRARAAKKDEAVMEIIKKSGPTLVEGMTWENTEDGKFYRYDGREWVEQQVVTQVVTTDTSDPGKLVGREGFEPSTS